MASSPSNYLFQEVQNEVFKLKSTKKKEKNISKCSLTVMASSPSNYLFQEVQDEVFKLKSTKKEKKRTLVNVL